MAVEIKEVGVESLPRYAEIPISFKVESILQVETISKGFGFGGKVYPTNPTPTLRMLEHHQVSDRM